MNVEGGVGGVCPQNDIEQDAWRMFFFFFHLIFLNWSTYIYTLRYSIFTRHFQTTTL